MYLVCVLSEAIPIASRQTLKSGQPFTGFIQKPYHVIVSIRWDLGRSGVGSFGPIWMLHVQVQDHRLTVIQLPIRALLSLTDCLAPPEWSRPVEIAASRY